MADRFADENNRFRKKRKILRNIAFVMLTPTAAFIIMIIGFVIGFRLVIF